MEKPVHQCAESKIQDEYLQLSVIAQSVSIPSARRECCIVSIMTFFRHIIKNVSDIPDTDNHSEENGMQKSSTWDICSGCCFFAWILFKISKW